MYKTVTLWVVDNTIRQPKLPMLHERVPILFSRNIGLHNVNTFIFLTMFDRI